MMEIPGRGPVALERPPGANGGWSDIGVLHAHQRVHRYRSTCLHNPEHGGSQCRCETPVVSVICIPQTTSEGAKAWVEHRRLSNMTTPRHLQACVREGRLV